MTSIKLFAGTDIGLRDNNEDNFIVCSDLTKDEWMVPADKQEPIRLGQRGSLVAVADGMGGMNAGEVASGIAIKTVQQMFAPSVLPASATDKPEAVIAYLKKVIIKADREVKNRCKIDPETEGMGSTIVIAWLLGNNVYIGWLGDSRAYSYIPDKGIHRLSKDHSYVQHLVDSKMLTEEEAMNHPESNVVLRSLGDDTQRAKPDIIVHPVCKDETILLCSDGLCGVCTDDRISQIIQQEYKDLPSCKEALTTAALKAGGSDNITVALLQIVDADNVVTATGNNWKLSHCFKRYDWLSWRNILFVIFSLAALGALGFLLSLMRKLNEPNTINVDKIVLELRADSISFCDTISYDVSIYPQNANQLYYLRCKNENVVIDTASRQLFLKGNVQEGVQIVAIAMEDSTKRDTAQLNIRKQIVVSENPVTDIKIDFRIKHDGPLERGKKYSYTVSISPEDVADYDYSIKCSSPAVTINKEDQIISVSENLSSDVDCSITITVKNVTEEYECQLVGDSLSLTESGGVFDQQPTKI